MPALLLDGSRDCSRRRGIPERPWRVASNDFERRKAEDEHANRAISGMRIAAVLLAGGDSRRMGQDKALVTFQGEPLWQRQLALLRKLQPDQIFVSARADPLWRPADCEFVADQSPSRGPLSGLAASLRRTNTNHLLALAIDMPLMTTDYLRSLCDRLEPGCGLLPVIEGRAEPLAACYPVEAERDALVALSGQDFSLQSLTQQLIQSGKLKTVAVAKTERQLFRNLNQPADLA
jgi:molybdenum cofactor guanylyltransferase